jgi:hypothetical protein
MPLPAENLRTNLATWAVPIDALPAVANVLHDLLPNEPFDPNFRGQHLETTYFDSPDYALRKARLTKSRYLTLRVRCYESEGGEETYALSAKTESEKFRLEIEPAHAHALLDGTAAPTADLPPHLRARLTELGVDHLKPRGESSNPAGNTLVPVVTVFCRRYAVEDDQDRLTLDCCVYTDRHKHLGYGVLEYKSSNRKTAPPGRLIRLGLRPLKLSKFLWATEV